jgi:hypothetical protein
MRAGLDGLPRELIARLTRELAGERILWAGQPAPRVALWSSIAIWLFAIPWLAFALAWELLALGVFINTGVGKVEGPGGIFSYLFPLFGLPFVLIGLGLVGTPFWKAYMAKRMVHVVTDKRLVTAQLRGALFSVETIEPRRIVSITRVEGKAGLGSMSLLLGMTRDSDGDLVERRETWVGVPEVKALENVLRSVMAGKG